METALTIRDLNKSFKQNLVLNGVDLVENHLRIDDGRFRHD